MKAEGTRNHGPAGPVRLDFRAGGWVLLVALVLIGAVFAWRISDLLRSHGRHAVGDGRHPETYGFELGNCRLPRAVLVGSGLPRDGLPVLDLPPIWGRAVVDSLARAGRNKYLVSSDRVIGVVLDGCARAYPLLVLNWHEVVNDTLGGRPVAVTYSPLCDAAVVYDRRIAHGPEGSLEEILLGHSGILYNSDPLLYDRRPAHRGESLWIQLTGRAVAGPAADARLALRGLSCQVVRWADWRERHPRTTVLARDPTRKEQYRSQPYVSYFGNDLLRYPVSPLPPRRDRAYKTPCLIVEDAASDPSAAGVFPLPEIAGHTGTGGTWRTSWRGEPLAFTYREDPATAWVEADSSLAVRQAFWFAWFAMNGGEETDRDSRPTESGH